MADLIPPHGGLTEPVCRTVPADEIASFKAEATTLPKVPVFRCRSVHGLSSGRREQLSPLTGPMNSETYHHVLDESVITHHGKKYAWTIPVAFPVTGEMAKSLKDGQKVALAGPDGEIAAIIAAGHHRCLSLAPN